MISITVQSIGDACRLSYCSWRRSCLACHARHRATARPGYRIRGGHQQRRGTRPGDSGRATDHFSRVFNAAAASRHIHIGGLHAGSRDIGVGSAFPLDARSTPKWSRRALRHRCRAIYFVRLGVFPVCHAPAYDRATSIREHNDRQVRNFSHEKNLSPGRQSIDAGANGAGQAPKRPTLFLEAARRPVRGEERNF